MNINHFTIDKELLIDVATMVLCKVVKFPPLFPLFRSCFADALRETLNRLFPTETERETGERRVDDGERNPLFFYL